MRKFARACAVLLLMGALALSAKAARADETSAQIPYTVVFDRALEDETKPEEIAAAWMGYALSRGNWVRAHLTPEAFAKDGYRRSLDEEAEGRATLAQIWKELKETKPELKDPYLDALVEVKEAGFVREYAWVYLGDEAWKPQPKGLRLKEFSAWKAKRLADHQPVTLATIEMGKGPQAP